MTLNKPAIMEHPTPSIPQKDLNPEPAPTLTAADRNDEVRRALVQRAFGSSKPAPGALVFKGPNMPGAARTLILQRVLDHGRGRGDVFTDDDHASATMRHGGRFALLGDSLSVTA